ncbi:MAG: MerR family transcriptional regulator [Burkholderiaceae bacterium]
MQTKQALPAIPAKRYFTIGEVSDLCAVKPHVLRYWEQEFSQLNPVKRRGNRRYYQHHEVLLIRRIRELLYEEGFTISGAKTKLSGGRIMATATEQTASDVQGIHLDGRASLAGGVGGYGVANQVSAPASPAQALANPSANPAGLSPMVRSELMAILNLLKGQ